MSTDQEIKRDVEQELAWNAAIGDSHIAVVVQDRVVTLAGYVDTLFERIEAERSAKHVHGVAGVANDIDVRLGANGRPDADIAHDALAALALQLPRSAAHLKVIASDGRLRLEGSVEWNYQRELAEQAVRGIRGVRSVANLIALKPSPLPGDIRHRIVSAFHRSADLEAHRINIETEGDTVILRGAVATWNEHEAAEKVAWQAPGVHHVINRLAIGPLAM